MFVYYDDDEKNQQTHLTPAEELRIEIIGRLLGVAVVIFIILASKYEWWDYIL